MPREVEPGKGTVDGWIERIEKAVGLGAFGVSGGQLVAVREVLLDAFELGLHFNAWEPVEAQEEAAQVRGSALYQWWMQTAHQEIEPMIAKMQEYGGQSRAVDLEEIGRGLVMSGVRRIDEATGPVGEAARYQELGCYFYLLGKFGRWTAAVAEGRPVSDDTLHDIGIYVRMVQRIRAVGGWPV